MSGVRLRRRRAATRARRFTRLRRRILWAVALNAVTYDFGYKLGGQDITDWCHWLVGSGDIVYGGPDGTFSPDGLRLTERGRKNL